MMIDRTQEVHELGFYDVPSHVEEYEQFEGIWYIKFSFDGAGADLLSWTNAAKFADAIRSAHPNIAAEVEKSIERAKRNTRLKH